MEIGLSEEIKLCKENDLEITLHNSRHNDQLFQDVVTIFFQKNDSPRDWSHIGIKKRTNHVIHHWKAYLSGSQKNHVNTILSVVFKIYGPSLQRPQISQYQFF